MIRENSKFMMTKLPLIGMASFLLFLFLSISSYPGGTIKNSAYVGYSYSENYLSDLGRTKTPAGADNTQSMLLFIAALAAISFSMAGFFYGNYSFFNRSFPKKGKGLTIGSFLFILSFAFLLGVGLTPANTMLTPHIFFAKWYFRIIFIAALCYTPAFYKLSKQTFFHAVGYGIIALSTGSYILFSDLKLGRHLFADMYVPDVISQKLIVVSLILGTGLVGFFNSRLLKNHRD